MTTTTTPKAGLPRIVRFLSRTDSGEYGNDSCAHCGALGRYQHHFVCEDGTMRAAMAGCIKLFPVSKVADVDRKLDEKAADYAKKGWKLPSWDQRKRAAVDAFFAGETTLEAALDQCKWADMDAKAYRAKKFGH